MDMFLRILLAACLGGIIGMERELAHKEAGLRTNILIAIGGTLLTILSIQFSQMGRIGDPARLAAQIVTGIGFIGAGAIMQARFAVHGLTTAATIWVVSGIGIAVGCGYYLFSFAVTIFVVIVLTVFRFFSQVLEKHHRIYAYAITTEAKASIIFDIRKVVTELNIRFVSASLNKVAHGYEIELILNTSENKNREFVDKIIQLKGITEIMSESL